MNEVYIEAKSVDYSNYLLNVDIKVHLNLEPCDDWLYLLLPVRYNSNLHFYIEPNSRNGTVLSGYLGRDGNFVAQFPPSNQSAEYYLTLTDVQIPINQSSDDDVFGYYNFSSFNISEDISDFKDNLVFIDSIHISDNNILYANPNAVQENGKDSLLFSFSDTPFDISIYISDKPSNNTLFISIIAGISALIIGIITGLNTGLYTLIKKHIKYKNHFKITSVVIVILEFCFFFFYICPKGYYTDLTFMTTISSLFGITIASSIVIFISARNSH